MKNKKNGFIKHRGKEKVCAPSKIERYERERYSKKGQTLNCSLSVSLSPYLSNVVSTKRM